MNMYMVLKATGKGNMSVRSAVVISLSKQCGKGRNKSVYVTGNIPELYHGMFIELELDSSNIVLDYHLELSDKNTAVLAKENINLDEYRSVLERHSVLKNSGIGWNAARMSLSDIYKTLPFEEADKLHKEMINNAQELTRMTAINDRIINNARRKRKIAYQIDEYLGYFDDVEQEGAYQHLMVSLKILCLQMSKYKFSGNSIWDSEMKAKEDYIKDNIAKRCSMEYSLMKNSEIYDYICQIHDSGLSQEQLNTLWCLKNSRPCVITGKAGTGKTTVIKTLIDCYSKYYSKKNILLVAPTGKASRRLVEKTGMPASTIHKALRKNPEDDFVFYSQDNPLQYNLVIVDESSMIDTELMYDLLSAAQPTCKLIFVGDHNQLYPVGYGEPFFDFLQTLDVFALNINHRQSEGTDILYNADNVLMNVPVESGRGVIVDHISYMDIGNILHTLNDNTQVISPYNDLNSEINYFLKKGDEKFNCGDKVIFLKNTKEYCNGDIGIVKSVNKDGLVVDVETKEINVSTGKFEDLSLAYSITIHKMQGSEAERIIVFIPEHDSFVDKRMLYTAVTRAKSQLEIYYFTQNEGSVATV